MTAMAEFQPLTHGYVIAFHGSLKANHESEAMPWFRPGLPWPGRRAMGGSYGCDGHAMVFSWFATARASSHGRQLWLDALPMASHEKTMAWPSES